MSYEIVYNRAFIKTTRGIIPLLLTGSNNCYEYTFKFHKSIFKKTHTIPPILIILINS